MIGRHLTPKIRVPSLSAPTRRGLQRWLLLGLILGGQLAGVSVTLAETSPAKTELNKPVEQNDQSEPAPDSRLILGWLEQAYVANIPFKLRAKLDTGAKTSSIHGKVLKTYERDGEKWLSFAFNWFNKEKAVKKRGKQVLVPPYFVIEAPIVRQVRIKDHKRMSDIRWVVKLPLLIAGQCVATEFTIANRKRFNYALLLGREFISDLALVDARETFVSSTFNRRALKKMVASVQPDHSAQPNSASQDSPDSVEPENATEISSDTKRQDMYKALSSCDPVGIQLTRIAEETSREEASTTTKAPDNPSDNSSDNTSDNTSRMPKNQPNHEQPGEQPNKRSADSSPTNAKDAPVHNQPSEAHTP